MNHNTLLVGCGGSGITTLLRFNEMLAGNPDCRKDIWEGISYLILDTEVKKTETFKDEIERQMGGPKTPIIKLCKVTAGYTLLSEIVNPNFEGQKNPEKLARLKKHWWYSPGVDSEGKPCADIPFKAQEIYPICDGAGQCGPVSYMATWNYLPSLERDVEDVLNQIKQRNIGKPNPLGGLRVYIVTGTAGGTGRGTWNLVSFKIRQYLKARGIQVMPEGIFFDASCFSSASKENPDERIAKELNSLTSFSELSAWMRIRQGGAFRYCLPNLTDPDLDGETDVISVPEDADNAEKSPVSAAYMIFGSNGSATLKDNRQYHEMAAAGLYAMVAGDEFLDPSKINRLERLGSFAATTFEVNTIGIRNYMEGAVRQKYAEKLAEGAARGGRLDKEADAVVGTMDCVLNPELDPEKATFFGQTKFCVPLPVNAQSIAPADAGKASILQLLIGKVSEMIGVDGDGNFKEFNAFEKSMREKRRVDAKTIGRKIHKAILLEDFEEEYAPQVEEFLKSRGLTDELIVEKMRETVLGAFAPQGMEPSVGRARAAAAKLVAAFETSKQNLIGNPDANQGVAIRDDATKADIASSDNAAEQYVNGPYKKAAEENGLFEHQFTDQEIDTLKKLYPDFKRYSIFFRVRQVLVRKFNKAISAIKKIDGSLEAMCDMLDKVAAQFREDLRAKFKATTDEEVLRLLFTDDSDDAVEADLPKADAHTNVYKRVLKPIMSKDTVTELLGAKESKNVNVGPIQKRLNEEIIKIVNEEYPSLEEAKYILRKEFVSLISNNVTLASSRSSDFMDRNFSFEKILMDNLQYWNRLLKHRSGSRDALDMITDRLRVFLGVQDSDYIEEEGYIRLDSTTIMANVAKQMVATCVPWIEIDPRRGGSSSFLFTLVLMPVELTEEKELALEKILTNSLGRTCKVVHRGSKADGGMRLPQDRIVAYASSGVNAPPDIDVNPMDCVKSLDYWRTPELKSRLVQAESKAGLCYFQPNKAGLKVPYIERARALGYVSPLFVQDSEFSDLRWKPWGDGNREDVIIMQGRKVDSALLFAFLGCGAGDDLRAAVRAAGWPDGEETGFPLLKMGAGKKTESFPFMREHVEWRDGAVKPALDTGIWEVGENLATSIDHVVDYLAGNGRPGEEASALRKSQEDGQTKREAILGELECFMSNIAPKLGSSAMKALIEARHAWLSAQKSAASTEDKKVWDRLLKLSADEIRGDK
jgi:hypothetical protein